MNADALREWLNRQPFEPFELRLSNGETYQIQHPEVIAVGRNRAVVVDPETDRATFIALVHINSIQGLQRA